MTARGSTAQAKLIIGLFPELLGVGGVQEAGRQTARALREIALRHGWSLSLLGLNDPAGAQALPGGEDTISFLGFGHSKRRFVLSALREARKDAHIVLAAHPHLALPAAWMKIVSPHLKTIVTSHGVEVWKPLSLFRRRALAHADCILAPSCDTAQKLLAVQGVADEKIRKLAWPLDSDLLRMADAPTGLPLPPSFPQGQTILTVGRWAASERYKGADHLIRAVAQLQTSFPALNLVAIGGGDDLPRLQKFASDLGVAGQVRFLDGISREELAACYARADIFALPSTGEGFGLVFLEAMAFAKPVVGAACGGTTDLVKDGINGLLVPPGDTERLTQTIVRLLLDPFLRAELGRQGAGMVRRDYGFAVFRAGLERILGQCGMDSSFSA